MDGCSAARDSKIENRRKTMKQEEKIFKILKGFQVGRRRCIGGASRAGSRETVKRLFKNRDHVIFDISYSENTPHTTHDTRRVFSRAHVRASEPHSRRSCVSVCITTAIKAETIGRKTWCVSGIVVACRATMCKRA